MLVLGELDDRLHEFLGVAVEAAVAARNFRVAEVLDVAREPGVPGLAVLPIETYVFDAVDEALRDRLHPRIVVKAFESRLIGKRRERLRLPPTVDRLSVLQPSCPASSRRG